VFRSKEFTSCCQDCSCAIDCLIIGNCCPDYVPPNVDNLPQKGECRSLDRIINYRLDNVPLGFQFKIVDYCPDHTSVDINTRCITPTAIEEIIPVSSRDGEKLFRNKYCAYCHGYMNIVMWGLYISEDCNNLIEQSFQSVEERNSYLLEHCHVKTFPPSSDYIQKVACTIGKVSTCRSTNSTILQKYQARCLQDSKVWDNELYQHRIRHVDIWFNNVYCFLCSDFVSTSAIENDQCTTMQCLLFSMQWFCVD